MNTEVADFLAGVEVKPATIADWLIAIAKLPVPHVSGTKVVQLKAMPEEHWELVA
ncbi:hypothetical protein J7E70_07995 [Variovorax paradoxus]|nr:hypothetical protein [Variovorax paradoxus]MBT2300405.1 hypothetical protein [Variovorax paradoxus]